MDLIPQMFPFEKCQKIKLEPNFKYFLHFETIFQLTVLCSIRTQNFAFRKNIEQGQQKIPMNAYSMMKIFRKELPVWKFACSFCLKNFMNVFLSPSIFSSPPHGALRRNISRFEGSVM